ncbi:MAG: ribosomal protein S18-alanine N-acetyltransferase [Wujia sp.]
MAYEVLYYNCAHMDALDENRLLQIATIEASSFRSVWSENMLRETAGQTYNHLWMAMDGRSVCGYLFASVIGDETELLRIAVAQKNRRSGCARQLMEEYLAFVQGMCERAFLEVRQQNLPAQKLYEEHGYASIAVRKDYYSQPVESAIIYEKKF